MARRKRKKGPSLNVYAFVASRTVCDEFLLFVKDVEKDDWYSINISKLKSEDCSLPSVRIGELQIEAIPYDGEPPKNHLKAI